MKISFTPRFIRIVYFRLVYCNAHLLCNCVCLKQYADFFLLEYAGELCIIVLKGEEESYIDSHTHTDTTQNAHTTTHAQGKTNVYIGLFFVRTLKQVTSNYFLRF